jgi:hypothetical protein
MRSLPLPPPVPSYNSPVQRLRPAFAFLALLVLLPACTVRSNPSAGVRTDARGRVVIVAPRCLDERIGAVQVADLDGPVRWRAEGGGNSYPTIFIVGREPSLMQETDTLEGPLDPNDACVATVEYTGSVRDVEVEFRPGQLSPDVIIDEEGRTSSEQEFLDAASLDCVGGWIWVFGGIALAIGLAFLVGIVVGLWVVVRVVRKARRARELESTPGRPDLSGR